jgi:S-(hydroxymethyl)glutathione dehydrogenase / alcohol dehydrogenase
MRDLMRSLGAIFRAPGEPLEVVDLDIEAPRAGEVLVRMAAVGICGSDLHVVKGEWPRPVPMVLGHEGVGTVEELGEGVMEVTVGDRVVISWAPACGQCGPCRLGRPTACERLRAAIAAGTTLDGTTRISLAGETVYRMTATGCLAEYVVVQANAALPLGEGIATDEAALLGCAALTGVGAVRNASRLGPGQSALVVGAGGVGQFVVQGARMAGAAEIVCVDPNPSRLERARALGATKVGHPDDLPSLIDDGVDVAFDAVGLPDTSALALAHTRATGQCVLVGMPPAGARLDLDPAEFTNREKTLTGSIYGSQDPAVALPLLLDDVREGRLELRSMLGERFPLEAADEAFRVSAAGSPGRVIVTPVP